ISVALTPKSNSYALTIIQPKDQCYSQQPYLQVTISVTDQCSAPATSTLFLTSMTTSRQYSAPYVESEIPSSSIILGDLELDS
ncbi:hypothetical protein HAX54_045812, partial [Datura stramonium]|nr:hypothetical protein [Datura stramonium]